MTRWPASLLAALLVVGAAGCGGESASQDEVDAPSSNADGEACPDGLVSDTAGQCVEPWSCPAGWSGRDGFGCDPPELRGDCGEGSFGLPDGSCAPAWPCPAGWSRSPAGLSCEPLPLSEACPAGSFALPSGGCSAPWVCPEGWERIPDTIGCAPRYDECPDGHRPVLGGGCDDLGLDTCGAWPPEDAPEGALLVDAGAAADGDGSPDAPFDSLEAAVARVQPGATLFLAPGRYAVGLAVDRDLTLVGTCAEEVALEGGLRVVDADVQLEGVTLDGAPAAFKGEVILEAGSPGLEVIRGEVNLKRVVLSGGLGGALVLGGRLEAAQVRVYGVGAAGIRGAHGAKVSCERCLIEGAVGAGLALRAASGSLRRSTVRHTAPAPGAFDGVGVHAAEGSRLEVDEVLVSRGVGHNVLIQDSTARVADLMSLECLLNARDEPFGSGLSVERSEANLQDVYLEGNRRFGLFAVGGETSLTARRVVSRGTTGGRVGLLSAGVAVGSGAFCAVEDLLSLGNAHHGIYAQRPGLLEVRGAEVRQTTTVPFTAGSGTGISVVTGEVDLSEVLVADNVTAGILVAGGTPSDAPSDFRDTPAHVRLSDVRIERHESSLIDGAPYGVGLGVQARTGAAGAWLEATDLRVTDNAVQSVGALGPAEVDLTRVLVSRTRYVEGALGTNGLQAGAGAQMRLEDVVVIGTEGVGIAAFTEGPDLPDADTSRITGQRVAVVGSVVPDGVVEGEFSAAGVGVATGADVDLSHVLIDVGEEAGAAALSPRTRLRLDLALIRGTTHGGERGFGLAVGPGASLTLERCRVEDNTAAGLLVAGVGASASLRGVLVSGTRARDVDGGFGVGVAAHEGAALSMDACRLADNHTAGLLATGQGTRLDASGLVVAGTNVRASDGALGHGVLVDRGTSLDLADFVLADNANAGLSVGSEATLRGGEIRSNDVGIERRFSPSLQVEAVSVRGNEVEDTTCGTVTCESESVGLDDLDPFAE